MRFSAPTGRDSERANGEREATRDPQGIRVHLHAFSHVDDWAMVSKEVVDYVEVDERVARHRSVGPPTEHDNDQGDKREHQWSVLER